MKFIIRHLASFAMLMGEDVGAAQQQQQHRQAHHRPDQAIHFFNFFDLWFHFTVKPFPMLRSTQFYSISNGETIISDLVVVVFIVECRLFFNQTFKYSSEHLWSVYFHMLICLVCFLSRESIIMIFCYRLEIKQQKHSFRFCNAYYWFRSGHKIRIKGLSTHFSSLLKFQ